MPDSLRPLDNLLSPQDETAFYRLLVKQLPHMAVIVFDLHMRYIAAEGVLLSMLGLSPDAIIGKTISEVLSAEAAEVLIPYYRAALDGQEVNFERAVSDYIYEAKVVPVRNSKGVIVGGMIVAHDVTKQKRYEALLNETLQIYRDMIENSMDAVLLTEPDGNILLANPEACRIFGKTEEELKEGGRNAIVDVNDPRLSAALEVRSRTGQFRGELTMLRRDGTPFPAEVSTRIFGTPKQLKTSMFIRDLTDRKIAEQQARELLLEKERTNILTNFVHTASHDLRTPLSIIKTSAYLAGKVNDPVKRSNYLEKIISSSDHLTELINDMLTMVILDNDAVMEFEPVNLNSLIHAVSDSLASAIQRKGLKVLYHLQEDLPSISGDYQYLHEALTNIAENAVQYTAQGTIYLETRFNGKAVVIDILDSGPGILDEDLPHIFERFYRADKARSIQKGGTGLGLSIAQRIVERHNGTIEAINQTTGALFRITLPVPSASQIYSKFQVD